MKRKICRTFQTLFYFVFFARIQYCCTVVLSIFRTCGGGRLESDGLFRRFEIVLVELEGIGRALMKDFDEGFDEELSLALWFAPATCAVCEFIINLMV